MKKLMTFFVVMFVLVQLSGCATSNLPREDSHIRNPYMNEVLEDGTALAVAKDCFNKWGIKGAVVCGVLTKTLVRAALYKEPPARAPVRYVNGGQYANAYASQQGCNGRSYCVQTVREVDSGVTREQQIQAFKKTPRFTIDNYMNVDGDGESPIPPNCQTPNLPLASICVRAWADDLSKKQKQCIKEEKARISPRRPQCNDTLAADAYDAKVLADQLDARQEVVQGGKIVYK